MTPNEEGSILGFQIIPVVVTASGELYQALPPGESPSVYPADHTQTVTIPAVYPDGSVFDIHVTSSKRAV